MKRALAWAAMALLAGTAASAVTINEMTVDDMDADGFYSADELRIVFPDISDEDFLLIDTDQNGVASEAELNAAAATGLFDEGEGVDE